MQTKRRGAASNLPNQRQLTWQLLALPIKAIDNASQPTCRAANTSNPSRQQQHPHAMIIPATMRRIPKRAKGKNSSSSVLTEHKELLYPMRMENMDKIQRFIEECGLYFEGIGLTRIAGRIIGWLLICDPPHQLQSELVDALGASKSSVSVALKDLTALYLVERFTLPGDRRTFYRTSKDMWSRSFRARMQQVTELKTLSEHGLEALREEPPQRKQRLEFMRDMNAFMEAEFPKLLDAWDEIKKAKGYDDL